jgi:Adenylyl/Guanylyl and SMODS C-terminal sensor domain
MRSYSATSNVESWYGSQQAKTTPTRISAIRTGAGHGTRARWIAACASCDALAWGDTSYCSDLPTALVEIVNALDDYLQAYAILPTIADPSCSGESFNHRWSQDEYANFRVRLHRYAENITDALNEPDEEKSVELWQSVFGEDFRQAASLKLLQASSASRALHDPEQDIEADLRFPIAPRYRGQARRARREKGRLPALQPADPLEHRRQGQGAGLLGRHARRRRRVRYLWKVRNTGEEASQADQVRGQIFKGGRYHREWTRYKGSHYVDVYIVQGDVCVALDRQRVVVK